MLVLTPRPCLTSRTMSVGRNLFRTVSGSHGPVQSVTGSHGPVQGVSGNYSPVQIVSRSHLPILVQRVSENDGQFKVSQGVLVLV